MANLVTNPDFEAGTTGWGNFGTSTVSQSSTQAHSGTFSCKVVSGASSQFGATTTTSVTGLTPNAYYKFSAWMFVSNAANSAQMYIDWRDSSDTPVSGGSEGSANAVASASAWVQLSAVCRAPATGVKARVVVRQNGSTSGDILYIDDVDFELMPGPELIPNPAMAADMSFWTPNINGFWTNAGGTLTRITTDSADGDGACGQCVSTGTALQGVQFFFSGAPALTRFRFSAWVKAVTGGGTIKLGLRDGVNALTAQVTTASTSWTRLYSTLTTGATGNSPLSLGISLSTTTGTFLFDAASLQVSPSPSSSSPFLAAA